MGKQNGTKYSNAGKGDKSRVSNKKRFDVNWEKIFGIESNTDRDSVQVDSKIIKKK